jgi:1,4-dihydroxy-6-naphthoate synthase
MKRDIDPMLMAKTDRIIRRSLEFAFANYPELPPYVRDNAQEMDEDVMRRHIGLYVNEFSLSLGKDGRAAIWNLLEVSNSLYPPPVAGSFEVFL